MKTVLSQDPHNTVQFREKELEVATGRQVRLLRKQRGWTIAQFAFEVEVSEGLVSKIEDGQVSPSLSMLQMLSRSLSVPLTFLAPTPPLGKGPLWLLANNGPFWPHRQQIKRSTTWQGLKP